MKGLEQASSFEATGIGNKSPMKMKYNADLSMKKKKVKQTCKVYFYFMFF